MEIKIKIKIMSKGMPSRHLFHPCHPYHPW